MSDDLPTPERLGRIERGVQRRIDRRRQVARQIAGASVTVLIVVGGVALVRPLLVLSTGSSASTAGGGTAKEVDGTAAGSSAAGIKVICHDGSVTRTVQARGALPASAIAACATAIGRSSTAARSDDLTTTPSPTPTPVLCESAKGTVHVYLGDSASCATHELMPYSD